ncbi:hypothetical protein CC2G_010986 [Coprinopsis cinerea AmutBmut pab1-1]|nr:hypothetical protein CC2G_010986 [Coprinopsis cinerea AmutBmut pab1-1]
MDRPQRQDHRFAPYGDRLAPKRGVRFADMGVKPQNAFNNLPGRTIYCRSSGNNQTMTPGLSEDRDKHSPPPITVATSIAKANAKKCILSSATAKEGRVNKNSGYELLVRLGLRDGVFTHRANPNITLQATVPPSVERDDMSGGITIATSTQPATKVTVTIEHDEQGVEGTVAIVTRLKPSPSYPLSPATFFLKDMANGTESEREFAQAAMNADRDFNPMGHGDPGRSCTNRDHDC